MSSVSAAIAALNDDLRRSFSGGRIMKTSGIDALNEDVQARVLDSVRSFASFTSDNDPHGEHDFGSFEIDGLRVFFKIDYYEKGSNLTAGAEHPEVQTTTDRVLTIMLADEY